MTERFDDQLPYPIRVWKVVRQDEKANFHSVCQAGNVDILYRMNKEVRPVVEDTPIFTFSNLKAAFAFKKAEHFILECYCDKLFSNNLEKILPSVALATISPERLYDFWCIPLEREKFITYRTMYKSKHTLLVSSVAPIKVITNAMALKEIYG